jgi:hypothetical protein
VAAVDGDGWVDEIAAQRAQPGQNQFLVGAGEPAIADDVGGEDRRQLSALRHVSPPQLAGAAYARFLVFSACTEPTGKVSTGSSVSLRSSSEGLRLRRKAPLRASLL